MSAFAFAVPGDPDSPTGGYAYARAVLAVWAAAGVAVQPVRLPDGFPDAGEAILSASAAILGALPPELPLLIDGLAFGVMPPALLRGLGRPLAALVHHPLALETGLAPGRATQFGASERAALAEAGAVIATSPATARMLAADYGVPAELLAVAPPGIAPASRARPTGPVPQILAVGAIIPRKDYPVLVAALARLRDRPWTCRIVGATDRDPAATATLRTAIAAEGLGERIIVTGALGPQALEDAFAGSSLFALPSRHEGFGMAIAEAIARGIPVVATTAGAIPETVPAGCGLLVPPGDVSGFADALGRLLSDAPLRHTMADAAWGCAAALPRWAGSATVIASVMARLTDQRRNAQSNSMSSPSA